MFNDSECFCGTDQEGGSKVEVGQLIHITNKGNISIETHGTSGRKFVVWLTEIHSDYSLKEVKFMMRVRGATTDAVLKLSLVEYNPISDSNRVISTRRDDLRLLGSDQWHSFEMPPNSDDLKVDPKNELRVINEIEENSDVEGQYRAKFSISGFAAVSSPN